MSWGGRGTRGGDRIATGLSPPLPPPPRPRAELQEPPAPPRPRAALQRQTTWAGRSLRDPPAAPQLVKSGSLSFPRAESTTLEAGVGQSEWGRAGQGAPGGARTPPPPPLPPAVLRALGAPEPPRVRDTAPASAEGSLSDVSFATDESERTDEGGAPSGGRREAESGGTPRRGLAAKLQQLLSPGKRPSPRHAAEGHGGPRDGSGTEQRDRDPPQRRSPMDTLLHPRERPESTASEVPPLPSPGWCWGAVVAPLSRRCHGCAPVPVCPRRAPSRWAASSTSRRRLWAATKPRSPPGTWRRSPPPWR